MAGGLVVGSRLSVDVPGHDAFGQVVEALEAAAGANHQLAGVEEYF